MVIDIAEVKAHDAARREDLRRSWGRTRTPRPTARVLSRLVGGARG